MSKTNMARLFAVKRVASYLLGEKFPSGKEYLHTKVSQTMKMNRWNQNHQPDHGRIVIVSDEVMSYWTPLETDEEWDGVAQEFARGYDHGDVSGEVKCYARLIIGGDEIQSAEFSFDETGVIFSFRKLLL